MFLKIFLTIVSVMFILPLNILAQREVDPCRFFPNNTKLRDPDNCSQSITCINFKAVYGTKKCSGSTPFYDKDKDACAKTLNDNSLCDIDCIGSTNDFVPDPKSCFGYYFCKDDELAVYGHCPQSFHFNYTQQSCIYSTESNCTVKSINFCAIVKDGVNFNDESSCVSYNVCKKGVLTSSDCKTGYYEPVSGKCAEKALVDCPVHPLPKNVCGTAKKPYKNTFVGDGATCRGYLYCADIGNGPDPNPSRGKCPENTFFNPAKQKCDNPLQVACSEDRCDGRTLTFVSSGTTGCRHYLRCVNGIVGEELSCGNKFFDEILGVCTAKIVNYPSCS